MSLEARLFKIKTYALVCKNNYMCIEWNQYYLIFFYLSGCDLCGAVTALWQRLELGNIKVL